jgi:hypothetical protein
VGLFSCAIAFMNCTFNISVYDYSLDARIRVLNFVTNLFIFHFNEFTMFGKLGQFKTVLIRKTVK